MAANGQVNNDQAAKQLTTAWNLSHTQEVKTWHQQVQIDLAEQEELTRLAEEEEDRCQAEDEHLKEEEKREQEKKKPKMGDFDKNQMVLDHVIP